MPAGASRKRERFLRIITPHALREHIVLNFYCLLPVFAQSALHKALASLQRGRGLLGHRARFQLQSLEGSDQAQPV
jgi:hypothetical protein